MALITIPGATQKKLSCVLKKHVFIDKPWKTVSKQTILDDIDELGDSSVFARYKNQFKNLKDPEVLVGFNTSNLDDEKFYVCITNAGRNRIIEELKLLHENHMKFIEKANGMEARPWTDLGSSEEIGLEVAQNNRPLISFEYLGVKAKRFTPVNFVNVDAGTTPHNYTFIKNTRAIEEQITAFCSNKAIQTSTECKESAAQTVPEIPINASTQFNPEIEAKEKEEALNEPVDTSALSDTFKKSCKKLLDALTYNEEYDLYKNDYEELATCGQLLQVYPFLEYKHFVMFADITGSRNKYITDTSWHPKYSGIVAVSYGNEVLCESVILESDSDESDFEYRPVPKKVFEPKIDKKKLIGEIVHAQSWMRNVLNYRKSRKRKEDESLNKLAGHSLRCLKHSRDLRSMVMKMEMEFEENIPELDELDFDDDFTYEKYTEGNPTAEEIIAQIKSKRDTMGKLQFVSSFFNLFSAIESGGRQYLSTKFDERIRQYRMGEKQIPTSEQMKTFKTIWDGKQWRLGEGIKDQALTIHKRHIAKAEKQIGKVILAPRNKSFFPFCRRKGKTDRQKNVQIKEHLRKVNSSVSGMSSSRPRPLVSSKRQKTSQYSLKVESDSRIDVLKKKKKKRDIYREITDDEDDEKKNAVNILSSEHPILIWWLANDLKAILHLDCPQEVHSIGFCPHDGDILVGGTITGQLVIWDLKGKLPPASTSILKDTGEKATYKILKRKMSWFKDLQVPNWIKYSAVTALSDSHSSKVVSIRWVPPNFEFNNGHFLPLKEEQGYSSQIISTSLDGEIKFWDLKATPRLKPAARYIERAVGVRNQFQKPPALTKDRSPYAEFHKRWPSKYSILCVSSNNLPIPITSIQFEPRLLPFERVTPLNPHGKDKMGDVLEYKLKLAFDPEASTVQNAFLGTMTGSVAFIEWKGKTAMGELDKPTETVVVKSFAAIHDGPITGVARHPFIENIAISTGGHIYAIWNTDDMTWPIMWKRYYGVTVSCCSWSPLRPSLYRIGRSDGFVEIWDLILQSHEPKILIPASGERIICFSSPLLKLPKGLLGICDSKASFILLYIPWFYQLWKKAELDKLNEIILREPPRREALLKWAETWRKMHVSRFAQRETAESKSNVIVKKKPIAIASQDAKPDCKKYYQELYKWYLRRRQRTPAWLVAMEQKKQTQEYDHVVHTILANKGVNLDTLREQMLPLIRKDNRLKAKEEKVLEMLGEADKIFQSAAKEIFVDPEHSKKASQISLRIGQEEAFDVTETLNEIELLFGPNGREMEKEYDEAISTKLELDDKLPFTKLVEKCKPSREVFNDRRRWRDPRNRWLREIVKNELEAHGLSFRQWENHKSKYAIKKYKKRVANLKDLKNTYGESYDPLWDFENHATDERDRSGQLVVDSQESIPFIPGKSYKYAKFQVDESSALDLDFLSNIDNINKMFAREHAIQFEKKKRRRKKKRATSSKRFGDSFSFSIGGSISSGVKPNISSTDSARASVDTTIFSQTSKSIDDEATIASVHMLSSTSDEDMEMSEDIEEEHVEVKENQYEAWKKRMEEKKEKDITTIRRIIAGKVDVPLEEGDEEYEFMDYNALSDNDEIVYSGESIPSPGSSPPSLSEYDWKANLFTQIDEDKDQPFTEHFEGPPPGRHIPEITRKPPLIEEGIDVEVLPLDRGHRPENIIVDEPILKTKKPAAETKVKKQVRHKVTEEEAQDEEAGAFETEQEEEEKLLLVFGSRSELEQDELEDENLDEEID